MAQRGIQCVVRVDGAPQSGSASRRMPRCRAAPDIAARPRQRHIHDLLHGAVLHHHHAVGEQHRLVEIVGDEQDGLAGARVDVDQFALHAPRASARRARRTARPSAGLSDRSRARARCRRAAACRRKADTGGGCRNPSGRPARDSAARCRAIRRRACLSFPARTSRFPARSATAAARHAGTPCRDRARSRSPRRRRPSRCRRSRLPAPSRCAAPWSCRSRSGRSARRSRRRAR